MSSNRSAPWRERPSEIELILIDAVNAGQHHCFLLQELGPTIFLIKDAALKGKFKVAIGHHQSCSCRKSKSAAESSVSAVGVCMHVLFVMLRVLKVPADSALIWQKSLTDAGSA